MRTRLLVVQPLFSVIVEESEPGPSHAECNSTGRASSPAPAGSAVLAILAALLAKVAADLPTAISGQIPALLEDLLGLITGAAAPGEEGDRGGPYAANGAILAALGNLSARHLPAARSSPFWPPFWPRWPRTCLRRSAAESQPSWRTSWA